MKTITLTNLLLICHLMIFSQEINKVIFEEAANQDILYGFCSSDALTAPPFDEWFVPEHNNYEPNIDIIGQISTLLEGVEIKIVLGTWCSDSRREVPRFLKIIESLNPQFNNLTLICVNRGKSAVEAGVEAGYVDFVPTFIVYRNGEEIGRIIEEPKQSLEQDLFSILKGLNN